ncbi:MAG: hypothetical protein A2W76_07695 [Gammaproteobacteria bacterium RIFCSPLOWO2_12_47_11]|nr:MAG: hypothetical protein A2W76_07695 [Gammaproteobacteria bacterium RIFCSPLOWO2_12_47_11]
MGEPVFYLSIGQRFIYSAPLWSPKAASNEALQNSGISQRQYDVLKLLAQGYSNKQIATTLFLTERTVKAHLSALFKCLNAANRTECVKTAYKAF